MTTGQCEVFSANLTKLTDIYVRAKNDETKAKGMYGFSLTSNSVRSHNHLISKHSFHSRIFSLIWRRHHYRWRAANFDLCSALMVNTVTRAIRLSVGHLRGTVTLTPNAERLAVELSQPGFTTWDCRGWDSITQPSACRAHALTDCATTAVHP
mgnify:CR=1 FL=1